MVDSDEAEVRYPTRLVIRFVDPGPIGPQIVGRLLSHGRPAYGAHRTRATADPLIGRGPRPGETPRHVAEAMDTAR